LVVDDNATNLAVANGLLSAYGMRVDTCESGREAIELVKTNDYDLVFMDHMMPDMDGTEATEILRETEEGRELPIIALTANAVSGMRELFMKSGMNDFLSKPIDLARLDSILHKWIPKNKQSGYEENFNSTKKSEKTSALETIALPKIAGVDTAEGVARVGGSISLYLGVLETYCRDAVSRTGFLRGFMDDKTDEKALMAFTTNVHALRSASANIGAIEVSRLSANLEGAARAADLAFIEENLSCFVDELEAIQARIRGAINEARSPAAGGGDGRDEVERLVSALEAWDISAVDEILEGLPARGSSMDQNTREQLSEISELILMSEFEKALDAARALQHTLGI
jgi:CheY-like chemotaxis protein